MTHTTTGVPPPQTSRATVKVRLQHLYVQFDLEQLRSAMQAVEDFVLQKVQEKPNHDNGVPFRDFVTKTWPFEAGNFRGT
jgi:hypothetical protein